MCVCVCVCLCSMCARVCDCVACIYTGVCVLVGKRGRDRECEGIWEREGRGGGGNRIR